MNLLILGRGKTGVLVAEYASRGGHEVEVLGSAENEGAQALTATALAPIDVVIDFTTPRAVMQNIAACALYQTNMVVGTTGWYDQMPRVRALVEQTGIGFVYAANFSIGVNLFFDIAQSAAAALRHGYTGQILERHHVHKKDAPSGTAVALRNVVREAAGVDVPIASEREGEVVGFHQLTLQSENDVIALAHNAHSRRGFAEGAVRAAEWLHGRTGFYDFKDVFREL